MFIYIIVLLQESLILNGQTTCFYLKMIKTWEYNLSVLVHMFVIMSARKLPKLSAWIGSQLLVSYKVT